MATQQLLSTGIKINVDATDLDVKFAKSAEALNRTLTKSQKALGLFYNEQGLLVNSQGQIVEGLSQAQIKLGQYVDELGRTRTYQGGFTEGLNASQKAMGWFSDEVGNVYDRLGRLVVESKRATDSFDDLEQATREAEAAQREYDDALTEMSSAADSALGSLGSLGGQTAQLFATIQAATGENDAFTSSIIAAGEGVSVFIDTYGAVVGVMQYMDALRRATIAQTAATQAATAAQNGLNVAMKANPVGLIVGGIAALTAAVATYKSTVQDAASDSVGAFAEIEAAAKRAGDAIKSAADVARFGFQNAAIPGDEYSQAFERMQTAQLQQQRAGGAVVDAGSWFDVFKAQLNIFSPDDEKQTWGALFGSLQREAAQNYEKANQDYISSANEFLQLQNQMIATARESVLTESQKLEAEKKGYEALLENARGTQDEAVLNAYIAELDRKIAAAKEEELAASRKPISESDYSLDSGALAQAVANGRYTIEEAQAAYQGALERQTKALESMGVVDLMKELETAKTPLQRLDDITTKLNAAYANGVIAQDKYAESLDAIAKKRADEQKKIDDAAKAAADEANAKTRSEYGIDDALSEIEAAVKAQKTPFATMNDAIAGYRTAMEKGAIDVVTFNKLSKHEYDKYLRATKEATDAAERERRDKIAALRNESGIDSLLESLKTPWEKYLDKLDKINEYVAGGAVTAAEAQLLADKALEEAAGQNATSQLDAAKQRAEAKAKTVDTARAGSAELYKMQLAQQNDKTAQMLDAQRQILQSSQTMALYLFEMQRNIAAMASNWPKVYGR